MTTTPSTLAAIDVGTNSFHLVVARVVGDGRFEVVDGPGSRWGAQGDATSVYVTDPDGNVVELRRY